VLSECRKSPRVRVFRVQSETSRGARGPQTLQSYRDDERRGRGSRSCAGSDPQPHVGVARVGVARVIADAARGGRALPLAVAPRWRRAAAPLRAAERGATGTDNRGYFAVPVAVPNPTPCPTPTVTSGEQPSGVKSICFFWMSVISPWTGTGGREREHTRDTGPGRLAGRRPLSSVIRDVPLGHYTVIDLTGSR
jgi:hypothetical protein